MGQATRLELYGVLIILVVVIMLVIERLAVDRVLIDDLLVTRYYAIQQNNNNNQTVIVESERMTDIIRRIKKTGTTDASGPTDPHNPANTDASSLKHLPAAVDAVHGSK